MFIFPDTPVYLNENVYDSSTFSGASLSTRIVNWMASSTFLRKASNIPVSYWCQTKESEIERLPHTKAFNIMSALESAPRTMTFRGWPLLPLPNGAVELLCESSGWDGLSMNSR